MKAATEVEVAVFVFEHPRAAEGDSWPSACLTPEDRACGARILEETARRQFLFRRIALRRVLAGVAGCAPEALCFERSQYGKPFLCSPANQTLHFNQSSTLTATLIAVSRQTPLGVDMEDIDPDRADERIASRWFPSAWQEASTKEEPGARFFRLWTRAEAILKADGRGLSALRDLTELAGSHTVVELSVGAERRAALAVPGKGLPVIHRITSKVCDLSRAPARRGGDQGAFPEILCGDQRGLRAFPE